MYLFRISYRDKRDNKKKKEKKRELWLSALAKNRLCGGSFTQAVELFGGLLKGKILGHQSQLRA